MVASRPSLNPPLEFSPEHLEAHATLLLAEGEKALLQGDQNGIELLEKAAELHPSSPQVFFRQGLALFEYGTRHKNLSALRKGAKKFHYATALNPQLAEAWSAWASTQAFIATLTSNEAELRLAADIIEKAVLLVDQECAPEVYEEAAQIFQRLHTLSKEIDDLYKALHYFEKGASSGGNISYEFWNEYGRASLDLSNSLQDIRPILKAISCYKQSIHHALSNFEGWIGLARSMRRLFLFSKEKEHYTQTCDCFAAACQLNNTNIQVWLERIAFMIESARLLKDRSHLQPILLTCEHAATLFAPPLKKLQLDDLKSQLEPRPPAIENKVKVSKYYLYLLSYWAEALALMGEWTHRIEHIQSAENKIEQALNEMEEEDPFLIHQSGKCLFSFARYFRDLDLYYQAIEEFQSSLSLDRTQLSNWIWMGTTYSKTYACTEDLKELEKAIYFYKKALQIKNEPAIYYELSALLIKWGQENREIESIEQALNYLEYLLQAYKTTCFENPEWFFQYGMALNLLGELKEDRSLHHRALEAFINVLMMNPLFPKIHHKIGIVYSNLGESLDDVDYFYRALHHFKLALRLREDDEMLLIDCGLAWIHLAQHATEQTMEENCFKEAEYRLMQAARLGNQLVYYQLACLYSLQGSIEGAMTFLYKSLHAKHLPSLEELLEDDWLETVRLSPQFHEFLAILNKN